MNMRDTVSMFGWLSVFVLSWMMLLGTVPPTLTAWGFWVFFLFVALAFSAPVSPTGVRELTRK